jgi:hypothetical protein
VEKVLRDVEGRGGDRQAVVRQVEAIYVELERLAPERGPSRAPPKK